MRWDYRKNLRTAAESLGLDPDDLESLDMRYFRHAATDDGARKSGHLSGLAYMAGHTEWHANQREWSRAAKMLTEFRVLGLLAQLVEQRTFNPTVQGSSP